MAFEPPQLRRAEGPPAFPGRRTAAAAVVDPPEAEDSTDEGGDAGIRKPFALRFLEDVPSWLSSGVFHLSMMLLLSLLVVNAPKGDLGLDVEMSGGAGGSQGGDDSDSAAAMQSFDNI